MREKVEGERDESEVRGNAESMRVSTETKAKTEALDIEKARAEAEAKEITQIAKADAKANSKVKAKGIEIIRSGNKARENVKA